MKLNWEPVSGVPAYSLRRALLSDGTVVCAERERPWVRQFQVRYEKEVLAANLPDIETAMVVGQTLVERLKRTTKVKEVSVQAKKAKRR